MIRYFDLDKPIERTEFRVYMVVFAALFLLGIHRLVAVSGMAGLLLDALIILAISLPFLIFAARRLMDLGKSGWSALLLLLPGYNLYLLAVLILRRGVRPTESIYRFPGPCIGAVLLWIGVILVYGFHAF